MNTPVLFLVGALALAGLMAMLVWLASRPKRERFGQSIDTFNRDLSALAPPDRRPSPRSGAHRPGSPPAMGQAARSAAGRPGPRPQLKQ